MKTILLLCLFLIQGPVYSASFMSGDADLISWDPVKIKIKESAIRRVVDGAIRDVDFSRFNSRTKSLSLRAYEFALKSGKLWAKVSLKAGKRECNKKPWGGWWCTPWLKTNAKIELSLPIHIRRSKVYLTVNTPKVSISNDLVRIIDDMLGKEVAYKIKGSIEKELSKYGKANINKLLKEKNEELSQIIGERDFNLEVRPEGLYLTVK